MIDYAEIPYGSPAYEAACTLRDVVLRQPIGMRLRDVDVAEDDTQFHYVALEDGQVVGTVIFKPIGATHIKLRQMGIAAHLQGKGVGRELVQFSENAVRTKGFRTVETSARHVVRAFYEKLGYEATGGIYEEVGLHTIKMTKTL